MRYSNFELPKLIFKLYLINSPEVTSGVFPLKVAVPNNLKGFFLLQTCNYFGLSSKVPSQEFLRKIWASGIFLFPHVLTKARYFL